MVPTVAALALTLPAVMLAQAAETSPEAAPPAPGAAQALGAGISEPDALPEVLYDPSLLPAPVRRLRDQIITAARSGDIERLRPVLEGNGITPLFSFGGDTDAISFWKQVSGDGEGRELLAIMIEVFEAGFVRVSQDGRNDIYVWPYFAELPLDALTPAQQVELYELATAQDVRDMREFGAYIFYRAGITADGQWQYFVAGD